MWRPPRTSWFARLSSSVASLLLQNESLKMATVDAIRVDNITREFMFTNIALQGLERWNFGSPKMLTRAKAKRPDDRKREKKMEMLRLNFSKMLRRNFFVLLIQQ